MSLSYLFLLAESAFKCSLQATAEELLSKEYSLSNDNRRICYDRNSESFTATIFPTGSGTGGESKDVIDYENAGFSLGNTPLVSVVSDILNEVRGPADILSSLELASPASSLSSSSSTSIASPLPAKAKFGLIWQIRFLRLMINQEGRRIFLECLYHAVHTLLCCYPDGSLLSQFFQDKPDLVRDFLWLLRTGPGSVGYVCGLVPIYLRQLSCQCLNAVVGSRDSANVSVLGGRFSWLQHDLGVNRYVHISTVQHESATTPSVFPDRCLCFTICSLIRDGVEKDRKKLFSTIDVSAVM